MNYLSVCSGIEAATVAWKPLGWNAVGFSEIEPFPCAVLAHHYPDVTNYGDLTKHEQWNIEPSTVDVLIGGTPCQSFSIAGLRKGLADPRGNLALVYLALVDRIRPRYVVWENVPGVLSSNKGRDFGAFLGALAELGYGWAYRILDAEYWGVAQRRRRVFVVGCLDGWQRAASVLFERESCTRNTPARGPKGEKSATDVANGSGTSGGFFGAIDQEFNAVADGRPMNTLIKHQRYPLPAIAYCEQPYSVANTLTRRMHKGINSTVDEGQTPVIAFEPGVARREGNPNRFIEDISPTHGCGIQSEIAPVIDCAGVSSVVGNFGVRRLTPTECERLQGFPDEYTNIPKASDGARYKALGNSMAVPVIRWIGDQIQAVEVIA
jgi:DNA (cytosine-5)-methyltransferase 1